MTKRVCIVTLTVLAWASILLLLRAYTYVAPTGSIGLTWEYTDAAPTWFKIYATTNLGLGVTNWPLFTNVPGTSTDGTGTWTTTSFWFTITPGRMFFVATATNFWGESQFSNVTSTPPVAVFPTNLTIRRTN